jgi:exonuclease SbcC
MRPLELTVEGFRSYRGPAKFDWRDRRLVGIVGPIGSGKSSILDAISFALYGKTPQVEGATKSLIHQLADQSHVELRFQVNGQVWRAVRSLRRKGQSGHQLQLLADDEPEAQVLETVTLERDMNARVEQLLGMDFKTFCRSVLLAQNRFAEFLKATPAQRDAVLKGVFGFERLDDALRVAKSRLDRVEMELASFEKERERVSDARAGLDQARAAAEATQARLASLEAAGPDIERLEKERDAAAGDAESAAGRIQMLEEIVAAVPPDPDVKAAIAAARDAGTRVEDRKAARERAEQLRREREAELADVASRHGDREQFRSFEHLVQAHEGQIDDVRSARAEAERAEAELTAARSLAEEREIAAAAATEALAASDEALAAVVQVVETARGSVMDAKHAEMAHELRGKLETGQPCPVCRQEVHTRPKAGAAPKVAAAQKALAKAERDEAGARAAKERCAAGDASARTAAAEASGRIGTAEAVLERATTTMAAADAALAATKSQLVEWLGEEGDVRALFEAREAELTAAERAVEEIRDQVEGARSAHEEAVRLSEDAGAKIATIANRLSGIWGRLDEDRDVPAGPDTIAAAFADVRQAIVARHERWSEERNEAVVRMEEATAARATLLGSLGLAADDDFRRALTEAGVAHGTAAALVNQLEELIAAASDLERRVLETEGRRGIAKRLVADLQPSRFLGFLLEEERSELAELGSEHFEQLTDNAYRFTDDDRFEILDLNAAGTRRKPDSLSGGETFLASLALALALAEMVARGGGRLDSFFLDEGFGSLDPDHLDRAMEGIGRLVSADDRRLVVLVSHVAEMREAIEDLIVLDKHEVTGDTIVRSGAGPAT